MDLTISALQDTKFFFPIEVIWEEIMNFIQNKTVYINGLFYKGSGIGRYYESITKELAKRGVSIITSDFLNIQDY
ncbi:MAG: hypothetical protein PWP68_527 [Rikenellaceae bacterium]|nr:hypothetical protein [Rikenellaceae bacterium]